jgi:hypothetical protein
MAVVQVVTVAVKPDRMEDYLALVRRIKPLLEKCGDRNIRVLTGVVAGEATGSVVFSAEVDDFAAAGGALDKFLADPEGQAAMATTTASDSPTASYQVSYWMDIPL